MYQQSLNLFDNPGGVVVSNARPDGCADVSVLLPKTGDAGPVAGPAAGAKIGKPLTKQSPHGFGAAAQASNKPNGSHRPAQRAVPSNSGSNAGPGATQRPIDHLAAARRLQRRLRKAPVRSPEEIRAGRLICRHLVALLQSGQS